MLTNKQIIITMKVAVRLLQSININLKEIKDRLSGQFSEG